MTFPVYQFQSRGHYHTGQRVRVIDSGISIRVIELLDARCVNGEPIRFAAFANELTFIGMWQTPLDNRLTTR